MPWMRATIVWSGLAVLMILMGGLREGFVRPLVGELRAHQLGSLAAALAIVAVASLALRWMGAAGRPDLQLRIGGLWLALTIAFELGFGHWIAGHSWERLLHDYDLAAGRLWPLVLAATLLGPWLAGRLRGVDPRAPGRIVREFAIEPAPDGGTRARLRPDDIGGHPVEWASWNAFVELLALTEPQALSAEQRPAQLAFWYDAEVQNGGHLQYVLNRGVDEARLAVDELRGLGAEAFSDLLAEALEAWERKERQPPDTPDEYVATALEDELGAYDARFYALRPTMHEILERHLAANTDLYLVLDSPP